jgi:thymidylate synthase
MKQYLELLQDVMDNGIDSDDRTGVGTRCVFGRQMRFNLQNGFPAVTTKKLAFNSMKAELLWFISGSTNVNDLRAIQYGEENRFNLEKKTVWDDNYNKQAIDLGYTDGYLGPVYGAQWSAFFGVNGDGCLNTINQLTNAIDMIQNNHESRRIIVSAWNPPQIDDMALPPCHMMFQFRVMRGALSCQVYIRSNDLLLGNPYNVASYAMLTHMIAQVTNLKVGDLIVTIGDAHIYKNHFDQVKEQLSRTPLALPTLKLNPDIRDIDDFKMEDIWMEGYQHLAPIKADMAV